MPSGRGAALGFHALEIGFRAQVVFVVLLQDGGSPARDAPGDFGVCPNPREVLGCAQTTLGADGWGFCPISHPMPTPISDVGMRCLGLEETDSPSCEMP